MILEKALVNYDKQGNYDNTLQSEFLAFNNERDALDYVNNHIIKNVEYYLYKDNVDVENGEHYNCIICNEI